MASDSESYGAKLAELAERIREQDEREKGLVEREGLIAVRKKSAAEQIEVADRLVVQSRERQSSVEGRERVLERKDNELRRLRRKFSNERRARPGRRVRK